MEIPWMIGWVSWMIGNTMDDWITNHEAIAVSCWVSGVSPQWWWHAVAVYVVLSSYSQTPPCQPWRAPGTPYWGCSRQQDGPGRGHDKASWRPLAVLDWAAGKQNILPMNCLKACMEFLVSVKPRIETQPIPATSIAKLGSIPCANLA